MYRFRTRFVLVGYRPAATTCDPIVEFSQFIFFYYIFPCIRSSNACWRLNCLECGRRETHLGRPSISYQLNSCFTCKPVLNRRDRERELGLVKKVGQSGLRNRSGFVVIRAFKNADTKCHKRAIVIKCINNWKARWNGTIWRNSTTENDVFTYSSNPTLNTVYAWLDDNGTF